MAQQNNRGIQLRQTENPRKKNRFWLMQTTAAIVSALTLVLTISHLTGFFGSGVMAAMAVSAVALCALYGLLLARKRTDWFFLGVQVVILLFVLVFRSRILEGFRLFWNSMGEARLLGTGWLLIPWERKLPQQEQELSLMLFGVLLSVCVSTVCCFLTVKVPCVLAVLIPVSALAGMFFLGIQPTLGRLVMILAVSVLILMYSGWGSANALSTVVRSWILGGTVVVVLVLLTMIPQVRNWTDQIGRTNQQAIHSYKYETGHTTLPEGDFSQYRSQEKAAEAALIVTMEQPQVLYLRGFTGSVFEDDQWLPLEKELLVKNKDLLYWLNSNAFDPNAQFYAASRQAELEQFKVTVQNLGACSRYCYVPFGLCGNDLLQPENLNTEGVLSDGSRVYSYQTVSTDSESIAKTLQTLQETEDAAALQYRKAESVYRQFVKNFYLQIPETARVQLAPLWDAAAAKNYGSVSDLTLQQAQECALRFLGDCFPETGTPEEVKLPLDIARGTSYQYATVAALTLRYYGIPARYAEGYIITEKLAATVQPGQTLTVDGSCARAWVEVYQDGIGWIPMELLPGIGEMIQEDPNDDSQEGDGETENEELEPEEAEEESPMQEDTETPDPDGGSVVQVTMIVLTTLLKVMILMLILFLLLFFRRRYIIRKREKKFREDSPREAVGWIFADTVKILNTLGCESGNGSLRMLCGPAESRFGEAYAEQLEQMIILNERSLFSSREMEEEHRGSMLSFRQETIEKANSHMKWYRRLWQKWIRCLY